MSKIPFKYCVESFARVNSIAKLNELLTEFLQDRGITTFAFTFYSYYPSSLNKVKYDYATPNYKLWHDHYITEGYEDVDTTLDVVYHTILPTEWHLKEQLTQAKSQRERKMREDSIAFGIERGVSIPIYGPNDDFAILLLVQLKGQHGLERFPDMQHEFVALANYYYNYLQKLLLKKTPAEPQFKLSSREMQCLTLLAKEYTLDNIAKTMHLTERTVNYHIQRLNKKLGTQNKYQSVMKAFTKGLIKL